jgi:hypothetical protein
MFSNGREVDLLRHGYAVLRDRRAAERLVDDHVAAGRPERDADDLRQLFRAGKELLASVVGIEQLLCHVYSVNHHRDTEITQETQRDAFLVILV